MYSLLLRRVGMKQPPAASCRRSRSGQVKSEVKLQHLFIKDAVISFIQEASSIYQHAVHHWNINHNIGIYKHNINSSTPVTPHINLTIELDTQLEPGPLGDGQPACEGAFSGDVHVHAINLCAWSRKQEIVLAALLPGEDCQEALGLVLGAWESIVRF